jgi:hypothetical protein
MNDGEVPRQLGAILDVLGFQPESLLAEHDQEAGKNRQQVFIWLYRILDILDSKTSHLLRFSALLLAAQTFLAGILVRNERIPPNISTLALLLLLVPLLTPLLGLPVFRVKWAFLGKVRESGADRGNEKRINEEIWALAKECDNRVHYHRRSFRACGVCVIAFGVTLVLALIVV